MGLDGLDYDLVNQWNLTALLQEQHGQVKVPINQKRGVPLSPEVWASFLAGKHVQRDFERPIAPLTPLFKILRCLRSRIVSPLGLTQRIKEMVGVEIHGQAKIGFGASLNETTFLDLTNSRAINVPYYNCDYTNFSILHQYDANKISHKKVIQLLKGVFAKRIRHILDEIPKLKDVDVVFAYINFPDALQHQMFTNPPFIKQHYAELDYYVQALMEKLGEEFLSIIISDHGFDLNAGSHSLHAFYSSNKPLNPKPTRITDFFNIFTKPKLES